VPELLRNPSRGREVKVLGVVGVSLMSGVWMEIWLESVVVVEGSTTRGMGIAVWILGTEMEGMGAPAVDMVRSMACRRDQQSQYEGLCTPENRQYGRSKTVVCLLCTSTSCKYFSLCWYK